MAEAPATATGGEEGPHVQRPAADLARHPLTATKTTGSQRLLAVAERGER